MMPIPSTQTSHKSQAPKINKPRISTVEELRELVNCGQFTLCLERAESMMNSLLRPKDHRDWLLLRAYALFELHRVAESTELLREAIVSDTSGWKDQHVMYAVARQTYMQGHIDKADDLFRLLWEEASEEDIQIKALLGMASTAMSAKRIHAMEPLLRKVEEFEPISQLDLRLALIYFQAMELWKREKRFDKAQTLLSQGLRLASQQGWNYYIQRFMFALAQIEKAHGSPETLDCYLALIRDMAKEQDSEHFAYLFNQTFIDHKTLITEFIEVDTVYRRVMIRNQWIDLTNKPDVFHLIRLLRNADGFVDHKEIASYLKPGKTFVKEIHVPFVNDLVSEARTILERSVEQPRILLKSELGFRLACA